MGGQLRPCQAEEEKKGLEGVFVVLQHNVKMVLEFLRDTEYAVRGQMDVYVSLHDEIATAEDLERMLGDVKIHVLTEEELADR